MRFTSEAIAWKLLACAPGSCMSVLGASDFIASDELVAVNIALWCCVTRGKRMAFNRKFLTNRSLSLRKIILFSSVVPSGSATKGFNDGRSRKSSSKSIAELYKE